VTRPVGISTNLFRSITGIFTVVGMQIARCLGSLFPMITGTKGERVSSWFKPGLGSIEGGVDVGDEFPRCDWGKIPTAGKDREDFL